MPFSRRRSASCDAPERCSHVKFRRLKQQFHQTSDLLPQAKASRNQAGRRCEGFGFTFGEKRDQKRKTAAKFPDRLCPTFTPNFRTPCTLHYRFIHYHQFTTSPYVSFPMTIWQLPRLYTDSLLYSLIAMANSSESRPVARATKPVSEALLNEKVRVPAIVIYHGLRPFGGD